MRIFFQPIPSEVWIEGEKKATMKDKARIAAEFLDKSIWNNNSTTEMWNAAHGER